MAKQRSLWVRLLINKYVLIILVFIAWMVFLDSHSWIVHDRLDDQIAEKEKELDYHLESIDRASGQIRTLNDSAGLEKFARERYHMKRDDEQVYLIEFQDSLPKNEEQ